VDQFRLVPNRVRHGDTLAQCLLDCKFSNAVCP
jgi:hypothetical protein